MLLSKSTGEIPLKVNYICDINFMTFVFLRKKKKLKFNFKVYLILLKSDKIFILE